jgi:hypothetical protein
MSKMKLARAAIALGLVTTTTVACAVTANDTDGEDLSTSSSALRRIGIDAEPAPKPVKPPPPPPPPPPKPTYPVVVATSIFVDTPSAPAPCVPVERELVLREPGRTCASLNKTTARGTYSATSIFPDAPEPVRSTRCRVKFEGVAGNCNADYRELDLTCQESFYGANPSTPTKPVAATQTGSSGDYEPPQEMFCRGFIPNGYVGGCDACGIVGGTRLYVINPFGTDVLFTDIHRLDETVERLRIDAPAASAFYIDLGAGYLEAPVAVWAPPPAQP